MGCNHFIEMKPNKKFTQVALILIIIVFGTLLYFDPYDFPFYYLYLSATSIVSLLMHGLDKIQAIRQSSRVPEVVLIGIGLAGGVFGSLLGMVIFRHKIRKAPFWITAAGGIIIHGYLVGVDLDLWPLFI